MEVWNLLKIKSNNNNIWYKMCSPDQKIHRKTIGNNYSNKKLSYLITSNKP